MNRATFFKHFELLAGQPDAVARMRALVLQLAVQGSLVPHSESEPAVPCISNEKKTPINVQHVPKNWRVILLADAIKNRSGNSKLIKGRLYDAPTPNLFQGFSASGADVWCEDYEHEGEAIIISAVGARCGKAFKAFGKWSAIANTNIARAEPILLDFDFAYLILNNEDFWIRGGSAQPFVKFPPSLDRYFALPPLAEQRRIVAKVDELMALCDELEQRQQARHDARQRLTQSAFHHLTAAKDPAEFRKRFDFILQHSSFILDEVPQLRQAILQLAVQGRLVPQNPKEGDGRKVVEQILKQRGLKLSANTTDEFPGLPKFWAAISGEDIFEVAGGIQKTPLRAPRENAFPYLRVANVQRGRLVLDDVQKFELGDGELERWRLQPNDLLVVEGNGSEDEIGRCAQWHGEIRDCVHQNHIIRCRPIGHDARFVILFFNSPAGIEEMKRRAITTSGLYSLSVGKIRSLPIPFPPLAEQKRIVARVEELMRLCDALEAQLIQSRTLGAHLLDSTLHHLLAA